MAEVSSDFLLDLYGCTRQPHRWRGVLDQLCSTMSVRSATVQLFGRDRFRLRQHWCARDSFSSAHAQQHDALVNNDANPRTDLRLTLPIGSDPILRDATMFAPGCSEMKALHRRLSSLGLGQAIGLEIPLHDDSALTLMLHRASDDDRIFSIEEERFLRMLAPHLEQMAQASAAFTAITAERDAGRAALNRVGAGMLACDADGRIVWLDDSARALIARSRHLAIRDGMLRPTAPGERDALGERIIAVTARTDAAPDRMAIVIGRGQADPLQALVCAAPPTEAGAAPLGPDRRHALVLLSEPHRRVTYATREIAELFGLSPAEAALAAALAAGASLQDYSAQRGISIGTARIQLKHVLAKTGTHRQAELVGQIARSVLGQAGAPLH